jgi:hypothetical protein
VVENPAKAEELYGQALALAEETARRDKDSVTARSFVGQVRTGLANAVARQHRRIEAIGLAEQAVAMLEKVAATPGGPSGEWHHLGCAYATLAGLYEAAGDAGRAAQYYREASRAVEKLAQAAPRNSGIRTALAQWREAARQRDRDG